MVWYTTVGYIEFTWFWYTTVGHIECICYGTRPSGTQRKNSIYTTVGQIAKAFYSAICTTVVYIEFLRCVHDRRANSIGLILAQLCRHLVFCLNVKYKRMSCGFFRRNCQAVLTGSTAYILYHRSTGRSMFLQYTQRAPQLCKLTRF